MRLGVFALVLLVLGNDVSRADQAAVLSGEHGDFTRLVFYLDDQTEWSLDQDQRTVLLKVDGQISGFDTSQVFNRIDRRRIFSVVSGQSPTELILQLACDCTVRAFRFGQRMLVLDVAGDPVAGDSVESPRLSETPGLSFGTVTEGGRPFQLPLILPAFERQPQTPSPDIPANRIDPQIREAVRDAEKRLVQQLGRAATQGLLKVASPGRVSPDQVANELREPAPVSVDLTERGDSIPLRATTSRDEALSAHMRINGESLDGGLCLPDDALAIAEWGGDGFAQGLAAWRSQLYGEFDRVNADAAIGMARHYLHYGFGAEARHSLSMQDGPQPILSILSFILDGEPVADPGSLPKQSVCDGSVAFWAVLAMSKSAPRTDINANAVIRYFMALPQHLRERLGPELAQRLIHHGYEDAASIVLRRMELKHSEPGAEIALAKASLSESAGETEQAQTARREAVVSDGPVSPMALAELIETELVEGRPITRETVQLAAAYAFENRLRPDGERLAFAEVLALAGSGDFPAAFEKLEASSFEDIGANRDLPWDVLVEKSVDPVFLQVALPRLTQASELESNVSNRIANRLLSLGFPTEASLVLRGGAAGPDGRQRRVLRAQAALALSRPRQAEAELLGLSGQDIDALRAKARDMAGDHAVAAQVYSSIDQKQAATRAAFLAGDWASLRTTEDPVLSDVARLKLKEQDVNEESGVLSRNRDLLSDSAETRKTLEALLSGFAVPDALPTETAGAGEIQ